MIRLHLLRLTLAAGIGAAAFTSSTDALALVPGTITHQGRLFDAGGLPLTGNFDIDFAIYDAVDAVAPIWMDTHNVDIDGYFSVALASQTPFYTTLFDGSIRWVGITVAGDPEMTPRDETLSVPYAFVPNNAIGNITPLTVDIQNFGPVINEQGQWVGDPTGLIGPERGDTKGYGGVGLGLALVMQLSQLLACTIELDSTVGKGSTFRVIVPQIWGGRTTGVIDVPQIELSPELGAE